MQTTENLTAPAPNSPAKLRLAPAGVLFGAILALWALVGHPLAASERTPDSWLLLPVSAGLGVALGSAAAYTVFAEAAAWLAILVVGQAASLRLVQAGPSLHYQHYVHWSELLSTSPLACLLLAGQAVLVISAFASRRKVVANWVGRTLGWRRGLLLALMIGLSSATGSMDLTSYVGELVFAAAVQVVAIGTVVLGVWALPDTAVENLTHRLRLLMHPDDSRPRVDRFAMVSAATVTAVAAFLCVVVYERHPHLQDEVQYLYQARYFAAGLLAMNPPPVPSAFGLYLLDVGSRGWFSVVPPGWAVVLGVGERFGVAWLVNPALSGLNVVLAYMVLWRLYDRRTARLAVLLMSASPWYLYLGMSFMPHMLTLTCFLVGVWSVMHARETGALYSTWIGGAAVGFLSLVRQLDGLIVALLLGLWSAGLGGRRLRFGSIVGLVMGTALVAALTLPYNRYFTGRATSFPIMVYNDRVYGANSNAYGFGPGRGMGWAIDPFPGHGPRDALINADLNATTMNVELFGWATGSLVFVYFLVLSRRLAGADWLCLASAGGVFVAYFFNYFSGGPDFGARYWFLMFVPALVLTVRGVRAMAASINLSGSALAHGRVTVAVLALSSVALVTFVSWRGLDKYRHYLGMRPDVRRMAATQPFGRSLVLVRGTEFPDYASAAIYNPIDVRADAPVFAYDRDATTRDQLSKAYADRPVWIVDGPTRTGSGYRVAAGPLEWTDLEQAEVP